MTTDPNHLHPQQLLRGLTFDHLFAVRTIASAGSFREASKILCLSQPAISQRVQHIEHILGASLFDRHSGIGVTLTATGEAFLEFCDRAMLELDGFWGRLATSATAETAMTLNISAPSDSIQHFIIQLLPAFRARFPLRKVRVRQSGSRSETVQSMRDGEADLAFYRMPLDPALRTIAIMDEKLVLVAAPHHPILAVPIGERPAALVHHSFATFSSSMRSRQLVERWALKAGVQLSVDIESKSLDVMQQAVLTGGVLSVMPGTAVHGQVRSGRLAVVEMSGMPLTRATAIAVESSSEKSQIVKDFVELLMDAGRAIDDPMMPDIRWATDARAASRTVTDLAG